MTLLNVKKQGYTLIENQPAMVVTDIDFTNLTENQLKGFSNINEALSSSYARTKGLAPEYIDESPTYDLYKDGELIQRDMTLEELETYFEMK
ncbi:TPA: hypothetical protein ACN4VG_002338 [Staphylococcus aureus]